jgi:hypothetical protein
MRGLLAMPASGSWESEWGIVNSLFHPSLCSAPAPVFVLP